MSDSKELPDNADAAPCPSRCYPSLPVQVAAKIARDIMARVLQGEFNSDRGFTKWGEVDLAFESEMLEASDGQTMPWDGQLQPAYERKLRKIHERFRDWPEQAAKECCDILANG